MVESVGPLCFFAPVLVQGGEREFVCGVGNRDDCVGAPANAAKPVVAAESGADGCGGGTVEPFAAITFRAPLTHTGDIADEFVDALR